MTILETVVLDVIIEIRQEKINASRLPDHALRIADDVYGKVMAKVNVTRDQIDLALHYLAINGRITIHETINDRAYALYP